MQRDLAFGQTGLAEFGFFAFGQDAVGQHQLGVENVLRAAAEYGQGTVGWHAADGLVVVEIVAELGHFGVVLVLASHQLALEQAFMPHPFTQVLHQGGIFGPALAQDVAHAI